jgi:hypothetical protein
MAFRFVPIPKPNIRIISFDVGCRNLAMSVIDVNPPKESDPTRFEYLLRHVELFDIIKHTILSCKYCDAKAVYNMKKEDSSIIPICRKKSCIKQTGIARAHALQQNILEPIHSSATPTPAAARSTRLAPLTSLVEGVLLQIIPSVKRFVDGEDDMENTLVSRQVHIVIESQPISGAASNQAMRSIQTMLHTLLYSNFRGRSSPLIFYNFQPSSKFTVCINEYFAEAEKQEQPQQPQDSAAEQEQQASAPGPVRREKSTTKRHRRLPKALVKRMSYDKRKAFSVLTTNTILNLPTDGALFDCGTNISNRTEQQQCLTTYQQAKKKDDLADSLIQGLSYARIFHEL